MELGGFFDDGLFEEQRDRHGRSTPISYNAKICNPQWFEKSTSEEAGDQMQLCKHRADWAYRCKDYQTALLNYESALDLLPQNNVTMMRDMFESVARCYLQLEQPQNALVASEKLAALGLSYDHKTVHLQLTASIFRALGRKRDEVLVLQKLIWLHPLLCDAWVRLSEIYVESLAYLIAEPQAEGKDRPATELGVESGFQAMTVSDRTYNVKYVQNRETNQCIKKGEGDISEELTLFSGLDPKHVVCTCLLRARALSGSVRRHPEFVTCRYQDIYANLSKQLSQLNLDPEMIKRHLQHVMSDLVVDSDKSCTPETELLKAIEDTDFQSVFESYWFTWT